MHDQDVKGSNKQVRSQLARVSLIGLALLTGAVWHLIQNTNSPYSEVTENAKNSALMRLPATAASISHLESIDSRANPQTVTTDEINSKIKTQPGEKESSTANINPAAIDTTDTKKALKDYTALKNIMLPKDDQENLKRNLLSDIRTQQKMVEVILDSNFSEAEKNTAVDYFMELFSLDPKSAWNQIEKIYLKPSPGDTLLYGIQLEILDFLLREHPSYASEVLQVWRHPQKEEIYQALRHDLTH